MNNFQGVVGGSFDGQYHHLGALRELDGMLNSDSQTAATSQANQGHAQGQWRSYLWDPRHVVEVCLH
jgi:hypothetical protein